MKFGFNKGTAEGLLSLAERYPHFHILDNVLNHIRSVHFDPSSPYYCPLDPLFRPVSVYQNTVTGSSTLGIPGLPFKIAHHSEKAAQQPWIDMGDLQITEGEEAEDMIWLYHGTVLKRAEEIILGTGEPEFSKGTDFGQGFYTSPDPDVALSYAIRLKKYVTNLSSLDSRESLPVVLGFRVNRESWKPVETCGELDLLHLPLEGDDWRTMVTSCYQQSRVPIQFRQLTSPHGRVIPVDLISGATSATTEYIPVHDNPQYCFKTKKARDEILKCLKLLIVFH